MILKNEPLSMAEAVEYIDKSEGGNTDAKGFIKKFTKMKPKDAKELRRKLKEMDLIKLRTEHIIKIIDLMPESQEELNKVVDVSLDEDETKKILETIKEFR